jgi:Protein of unknown function (DUF3892)
MAKYRISGVWTGSNNAISHYAIHEVTQGNDNVVNKPVKTSKADAIKLLETKGNTATTLVWNYVHAGWYIGEAVEIVGTGSGKYLRSNPDKSITDNLGHLPNFSLIY